MQERLLSLILFTPLAGLLVLLFIPGSKKNLIRWWANITAFAGNVDSLMNHGAMMIISVPFAWEIHAFPSDYWRFTPGALEFLFPHVEFDLRLSRLHTDTGLTASLADVGGDFNAWITMHPARSRPGGPVPARWKKAAHSLARRVLGLKKDTMPLHSTMFDMVGFKKKA